MSVKLLRLDLYIPEDNSRPCPVMAFVTGGAWIIGLVYSMDGFEMRFFFYEIEMRFY
jgi:carboxylesterase type B